MDHRFDPTPNGRPRKRRDLWPFAAFALAAAQLAFRLVPELRPGASGVVCWMLGMGLVPLAARVVLAVGAVWSLVRRPFWTRRRGLAFALLVALAFSDALFQTYPSSHDGRPSRVAFRLPLDGPVTVFWGGGRPDLNYHVDEPAQRWAYDVLVMRDGVSHRGDGSLLTDYYAYGLPVLAPAAGTVVEAFDGDPDMAPGQLGGGTSPAGNHVVINVAPGEFVWLCHLKPESVRVRKGDRVAAGQPVGRVGNSGNTSEPHLHTHLQDSTDLELGEGIPMPFRHYKTADGRAVARGIPTGGFDRSGRFIGQTVEDAPEVGDPGPEAPR